MPKPIIIGAGIAAGVVAIGIVGYVIVSNNNTGKTADPSTSQSTSNEVALVDPDGVYKLFSDPSVTSHPEDNAVFGNGQTLTFEYDGSKTANDPYATLSYQLYYIQDDGKVQPMGGGNMEGSGGKGTLTVSDKVFDSAASGHSGFFELQGTYDTSADENNKISSKNVTLGMYSIKFDIAD